MTREEPLSKVRPVSSPSSSPPVRLQPLRKGRRPARKSLPHPARLLCAGTIHSFDLGTEAIIRHPHAMHTLTAALAPLVAGAEVRLPNIFSNHMVLQRGVPLKVW